MSGAIYLSQHFGPEWDNILTAQQVNCQRSCCRFAGSADCEHGSRLLVSDTSFGGVDDERLIYIYVTAATTLLNSLLMRPRKLSTGSTATSIRPRRCNTAIQRIGDWSSAYNVIQGRPRLKKAIADAYSSSFGRTINPDTEVTITTGANEGWA